MYYSRFAWMDHPKTAYNKECWAKWRYENHPIRKVEASPHIFFTQGLTLLTPFLDTLPQNVFMAA
jgi:hypothetical protein